MLQSGIHSLDPRFRGDDKLHFARVSNLMSHVSSLIKIRILGAVRTIIRGKK